MSHRDRDLPIGVFDSGMGGLTVLKSLRERLPSEDLLYLGDTARLPYGSKSAAAIGQYALQAARCLVGQGIKALVVADNTSSAHALETLRANFPGLPVIGVVEPGAAAAANASGAGRIAVIASESTVQNGAYPRAILHHRPGARVIAKPTPFLVPMVEEGLVDGPIAELALHHYLDDLFLTPDTGRRCDCLLLGCTHFPALMPLLRRLLGDDVAIVDSATTTARAVEELLDNRGLARGGDPHQGQSHYLVTDAPDRFARVASVFVPWGIDEGDVRWVDIG